MPAPIPILFVIDHFKSPNAGTEGQLYLLIKHLDRAVFAPELLVFSGSEWLSKHEFPCPVTVLGSRSLSSLQTWVKLRRFAKAYRQKGGELAHVFFNDPSIICPPVFFSCGIKTIISRRDMGYWYTPVYKAILNITRYCVTGLIANSKAVAQISCEAEGYKAQQVAVIYNGYEAPNGDSAPPVNQLLELKAKGRVLMGLAANIRPIKRIDDVLYALSLLKDSCPTLDFVQMGDGDAVALKSLAAELGIGERVHYLGKRSDIKACLQVLDMGLLCSESEGFSNAIVEYLQQGLPVICSNVGGNGEAISHGDNGFLYPCGDIKQLAKHIEQLVQNKQLRASMAQKAKQGAVAKYTVANMVNQHQHYYLAIINNKNTEVVSE